MKFIVKIVLGLFIIFLATPTIVTALDSDVNLSYFYNLGEEEESHSTFNEIKFIPSIFSIPLKIDFEGYQRIAKELESAGLSIPIYSIGGIVQNDVELLKKTGIYGIAVSGMIAHAADKRTLVSEINQTLNYV